MDAPLARIIKEKGYFVHTVLPEENVFAAAAKLNNLGIGALLVVKDDELLGIISERDIIRKLINCQCDPAKVKVAEIMTRDVITATTLTTVQEAMRIMTIQRFRHLPLVDNHRIEGIVTIGDLVHWLISNQEKEISTLTHYISGGQ